PCRPTGPSLSLTRYLDEIKSKAELAKDDQPKQEDKKEKEPRFQIPEGLPGADIAPLTIPKFDQNEPLKDRQKKIRDTYSEIPELPPLPFAENQEGMMSLAELQTIAFENSPVLAAAAARVEQARGEAIQAGLYPNPEIAYVGDSINTSDTQGYNGAGISQTIVTADKLKISSSVEWQDVLIAESELRQVKINVATAVRENYFKALVAQERLKFSRGLVELFTETYQGQIELVVGGESAPYEPLQIRVFAVKAQNDAIVAANDYVAAWRRLAAVLNAPHLTPHVLEGSPEMPVPQIGYEQAIETMLSRHTDLSISQTQIQRGELDLWLQQRTPIPNLDLQGEAQLDDTSPLNDMAFNLRVGFALPIFNKNQGNIYTAESRLVESHQKLNAAQNQLTADLAEIYARYTSNRLLAENYRNQIIPDQIRTYQSTYQRYRQGADTIDFAQIITSLQQLGQVVGDYVAILGDQWQAVVDLAKILQADDLYSLGQGIDLPSVPICPPETLQVPTPIPE
ncbi:MAG: TolC family protein, partial [Planctomycetaceae bacterium]|nr:TolC family protein [Planctomycetaceae bacterium]